jgi:hypothetical protein
MIKSLKIRWVEQVKCIGEMRNAYVILIDEPEGKRIRDLGIDGKGKAIPVQGHGGP